MSSTIAAVLLVLILAVPAGAGQGATAQAGSTGADNATAQDSAGAIDVDRLPLDLRRIQRRLNQYGDREERDGLNLRYQIQIYGFAPPIQFFSEDANLVNGPVPYGAPTHREIIEHVTPQEFRTPYMDFSALIRWLAERNKKK